MWQRDGGVLCASAWLCAAHAWPRFDAAWGTRLFSMIVPREGH